jgi:hypothetical protein
MSPANGAAVARGADNRNRTRLHKAPDGGDGSDPVAVLKPVASLGRERCRKLDVDRAGHGRDLHGKSGLPEHIDHPMVRRKHLGLEQPDSVVGCRLGEVGQEDRAEAPALEFVRDRK